MTYAAPEQISGSQYLDKSDIYSLGIILFEMLNDFQTGLFYFSNLSSLHQFACVCQKWLCATLELPIALLACPPGMERARALSALRKGIIPSDFDKGHPEEVHCVN